MFAKIISVDWESALLSYSTKSLSFIKAKLNDKNGNSHSWESVEANSIGRMELDGLAPDCSYSGEFESSDGCVPIEVTTLPTPEGEMLVPT